MNPNLARHVNDIVTELHRAERRGDHAHAEVRAGMGTTQAGPVLGYAYDPKAVDGGWIEIRNYKGARVRVTLAEVILGDGLRPCWDHC